MRSLAAAHTWCFLMYSMSSAMEGMEAGKIGRTGCPDYFFRWG
jgi:hypothetical protein